MDGLAHWLQPGWPAPAGIHAVCSSRSGGRSHAPYDRLNLGDHVGDDPAHVAANRAIFEQAIGAKPVFLKQVHGSQVLQLGVATPNACVADASLTALPGLACTVLVADCLAVVLTTTQGHCVAAAHAGWRGLAGSGGHGIVEQTYQCFKALMLTQQAHADTEIIAWLSPCIGPQAFEVGADVRSAFVTHDAAAAQMFEARGSGKWLANLAGLARQRLAALGISQIHGNDGSQHWCTVAQRSRYFSYRRDGLSGRFAVSIWRGA